jgi:iron-sulfur cluster assembly accessory protein
MPTAQHQTEQGPPMSDAAVLDASASEAPVTLTASAARRIAEVLKSEPAGSRMRLGVNGGGCSGFSYDFQFVAAGEPDDIAVSRDGVTLLVDAVAVPYLAGAEVDFVDDLMGQYFKVNNPNATATCGCGTSFAV